MGANYFSKDNDDNENKLCWAETPDDLPINAYAKIDKPEFSVEFVPGGATAKVNCNVQFVFNISWLCLTGVEITGTIVKTTTVTFRSKVAAAASTFFGPIGLLIYALLRKKTAPADVEDALSENKRSDVSKQGENIKIDGDK